MEAFFQDFHAMATPVGRGDYAFRLPGGEVLGFIQIIPARGKRIQIHRFWTRHQGKGHGRTMLRWLCDLADRHGVELQLKALPIGRKPYPLSRDQLCQWYQRYGFEGTRRKLIRKPISPA
jgi:GNAT superfamily N-acetyltransferase